MIAISDSGAPVDTGASWAAPARVAAPAGAFAPGWYDPEKVAGATAGQAAAGGNAGTQILSGAWLLSILNPIAAPEYVAAQTVHQGNGELGDTYRTDPAYFKSANGQALSVFDGAQLGDPGGLYFSDTYDNPTGTGKRDQAQVIYRVDGATATPVAAGNAYAPGWWTDWGQTLAAIVAVLATAGTTAYLAGAGAAVEGTGAAVGTGTGAAAVEGTGAAVGSGSVAAEDSFATYLAELGGNSTIDSGLSFGGFNGAGGGYALTDVGISGAQGITDAWLGTAAATPATFTFAAQGIDIGATVASAAAPAASSSPASSAADSLVNQAPTATSAAKGASLADQAGQLLGLAGKGASLVTTGAGLVNALTGKPSSSPAPSSSSSSPAAGAQSLPSPLLALLLIGGAALFLKG